MVKQDKKEIIKNQIHSALVEQKVIKPVEQPIQSEVASSDTDVRKMLLQLELCHFELQEQELQQQH